ncbi:hypothetical protein AB0M39_37860 [Streptomyces sp. NPDC051907]|uniref:hypothetical protein n=1 Tax=Streptomyces sp. NPDC051907 TaxID=3155284 RepID=UPI00344ACFBF
MTCPHCALQLGRTERTGGVCAHCKRAFALDPRTDGRGMHDLRIRRCVERASDDGRLKVTLTQLWYASRTANDVWGATERRGVPAWIRWLAALPVAAVLVVCAVLADGVLAFVVGAAAPAVLVVAASLRYRPARPAGSLVEPPEYRFRGLMKGSWTRVYGGLPDGVVDDEPPTSRSNPSSTSSTSGESRRTGKPSMPTASKPAPRPRAVIVCTDHAVAVFLAANDIPARLEAVLVEADGLGADFVVQEALAELAGLRGDLPVVVLHSATAQGVLVAPLLRAAHPGRVVVDAGLPVAAVKDRRHAVRLVEDWPPDEIDQLRTVAGLSEAEAAWLAQGFWSPLAAVPPPLLEAVVVRAVERARTAPPPGPGAAQSQGFLTWPQEPGDTGGQGERTSRREGTRPL